MHASESTDLCRRKRFGLSPARRGRGRGWLRMPHCESAEFRRTPLCRTPVRRSSLATATQREDSGTMTESAYETTNLFLEEGLKALNLDERYRTLLLTP